MMGSSRPTDPRIESVTETLGILRLLSNPDGLKQVLNELQTAHDQIVASLAEETKNIDLLTAALVQQRKELEAKAQLVDKKEADVTNREAVLSVGEAEAAKAVATLKANQDTLAVELVELEKAKADFNQTMADKTAKLESQHNERSAALTEAESQLAKQVKGRKEELDQRQASIEESLKDLTTRTANITKREKEISAALDNAKALEAQHKTNLNEFQKFIKATTA